MSLTEPRVLFEQRVRKTDGCWIWNGSIMANGYGTLKIGGRKGKRVYSHRLAYELYVGPIPDGLDLDHLCRNRKCCNPMHLEPVTRQVNTLRGVGPAKLGALNGSKTHCTKGHEFTPENTRYRPTGGRSCRRCAREMARVKRHRTKTGPEEIRQVAD